MIHHATDNKQRDGVEDFGTLEGLPPGRAQHVGGE